MFNLRFHKAETPSGMVHWAKFTFRMSREQSGTLREEGKMRHRLLKIRASFFFCLFLLFLFPVMGYSQGEDIAKFPRRPITYIMPYPAGNTSDLAVRLIAKEAEKFLGQSVVVINKPGASGTLGAAAVATAKPDGYTVGMLGSSALFIVPNFEAVPYNTVNDFTYIMQYGAFNMGVIVKADSPFKTFNDLIVYARQNPKKLTYGTTGVNSTQDLIMQLICKKEKLEMTHIPFKGTFEAQTALLGGHIICAVGDFSYSLMEAGQARLLLVLRQEKSEEYPETPVLKDLGYDFWEPAVMNATGPKGIPEGIAKRLEEAFTKAAKEPAFIKGMRDIHMPIFYRNSKELKDYVAYNYEFWRKFIKEKGLAK